MQTFVLRGVDDELWIAATEALDRAEDVHFLFVVQFVDDDSSATEQSRLPHAITAVHKQAAAYIKKATDRLIKNKFAKDILLVDNYFGLRIFCCQGRI